MASGLPADGGGRWSPGHFEFIVLGTPCHPHTAPHLQVRKLSLREVKHALKSQPEWPISPPWDTSQREFPENSGVRWSTHLAPKDPLFHMFLFGRYDGRASSVSRMQALEEI